MLNSVLPAWMCCKCSTLNQNLGACTNCGALISTPGNYSVGALEADEEESKEAVHHPSHYNQGKIEVIEFIEDKELGFHLGNAVKYISRAGKKNVDKTVEDLEKAIWYIKREIELHVSRTTGREAIKPNDMKKG